MSEWYKEWFDDDYLKVYSHRNDEDAKTLIETVLKYIDIEKNAFVLDAACGAGRHSRLMAEYGFRVIGFDLSESLLKAANENRKKNEVYFHLVKSDFRQIFFKNKFDLILNLFTSFGYFESDEENFKFVTNAYRFLNRGGYYIFDFINKDFLTDNLIADTRKNIKGIEIFEKRKIENNRVIKNIILDNQGKKKEYIESVKLYDSEELIDAFKKIGYKIKKIFGDYKGSEFILKESQRLVIILEK